MPTHNNHEFLAVEVVDLLIRTSRNIQLEYEAQLKSLALPYQLSGARLRLLLKVWREEKIRMNELANKLGVKARTVTELVDALEREGLIYRVQDLDDRRAIQLQLTDEALAQINNVRSIQKEISDKLLQNFTIEQRSELFSLLSLFFEDKEFEVVY